MCTFTTVVVLFCKRYDIKLPINDLSIIFSVAPFHLLISRYHNCNDSSAVFKEMFKNQYLL